MLYFSSRNLKLIDVDVAFIGDHDGMPVRQLDHRVTWNDRVITNTNLIVA